MSTLPLWVCTSTSTRLFFADEGRHACYGDAAVLCVHAFDIVGQQALEESYLYLLVGEVEGVEGSFVVVVVVVLL